MIKTCCDNKRGTVIPPSVTSLVSLYLADSLENEDKTEIFLGRERGKIIGLSGSEMEIGKGKRKPKCEQWIPQKKKKNNVSSGAKMIDQIFKLLLYQD